MESFPTTIEPLEDPRYYPEVTPGAVPQVLTARDLVEQNRQAAYFSQLATPEAVEQVESLDDRRARLGSRIGANAVNGVDEVFAEVFYGMGARHNRKVAKFGELAIAA